MVKRCLPLFSICLVAAWAGTVRVENPVGNVSAHVVMGAEKVEVKVSVPSRPRRPEDVRYTEQLGLLLIQCQPADGARVDIDLALPHTATLEAVTGSGAISVSGLVRKANLTTDSGDIRLSLPYNLERLRITAARKPKRLILPKGIPGMVFVRWTRKGVWNLEFPKISLSYGAPPPARGSGGSGGLMLQESPVDPNPEIQVKINSPGRIELIDEPVPADSWVRDFHNVYDVLQRLLTAPPAEAESVDSNLEFETQRADGGGAPVFVSQVRMVTLTAAVYDREGHPLPGLKPEDFEVVEDGVAQKVAAAGSEEVPFDLVLFLDLSGSTAEHRPAMMEAARRFVGVARPQDRVAIYAGALGLFHVFSTLTSDRQRLNQLIDTIPLVGSGSALYAAIALCYAQESIYLGKRRSALVFLSDGVDGSLLPRHGRAIFGMPPEARLDPVFPQLRQVVGRMPVLFYPVLLPPPSFYPQGAEIAREQMQQLADASGGRLFPAASLDQLEPVYAQVADELRSVYTISYYPRNQKFDGKWRRVQVRLKGDKATLRTRQGYYAW